MCRLDKMLSPAYKSLGRYKSWNENFHQNDPELIVNDNYFNIDYTVLVNNLMCLFFLQSTTIYFAQMQYQATKK